MRESGAAMGQASLPPPPPWARAQEALAEVTETEE